MSDHSVTTIYSPKNPRRTPLPVRALAVIALLFCTVLHTSAQIGEQRHTVAVGFNGGVSMNTISFDPTIKQKQHIGPTFGVTLRLTSEKYFKTLCALQIEANYAQLGWNEDIYNSADEPLPDTYQRHLNYIQVPLLARLGWGRERRGLMGYLIAGPQIGFCIGESTARSDQWTLNSEGNPDRPNSMYAQYDMPIEKKFDYGITAGLGLEVSTAIGHFMVDGRYYYGLSDIYGNSKKDVFSRSNNGTITVKLTYLFDLKK